MRALVTGAGGFLGRHLVQSLEGQTDVSTFDGDICDSAAYQSLAPVDVVFHLAAISNVPASIADPVRTWKVNAEGTVKLLEWARQSDVGRVVLVSTGHVYGRAEYSPIDERHPTNPVSPYGASKLAAEAMARAYQSTYGMDIVTVRPFNIYGPGQALGFLVPDIMIPLAAGNTPRLGRPDPVRDFTYVDDAVRFLQQAGTVPGISGARLNLGSGEGHSAGEIARLSVEISGLDVEPTFNTGKPRVGDMDVLIVDNRLAVKTLSWKPTVPLREGLARTWESFRLRAKA